MPHTTFTEMIEYERRIPIRDTNLHLRELYDLSTTCRAKGTCAG